MKLFAHTTGVELIHHDLYFLGRKPYQKRGEELLGIRLNQLLRLFRRFGAVLVDDFRKVHEPMLPHGVDDTTEDVRYQFEEGHVVLIDEQELIIVYFVSLTFRPKNFGDFSDSLSLFLFCDVLSL